MRNSFSGVIIGLARGLAGGLAAGLAGSLVGVLAFSSIAMAQMPRQGQQTQPQQDAHTNPVWMYDGLNRVSGSGGPAPKHDLTGTWAGPRSGAGVPDFKGGDTPSLTPLGQKLFGERKSLQKFSPAGTNDPTVRTCDPFGFPRAATDEIRGISFGTAPNRVIVLYQFQQVWREIWTDGRALPKNIGAAEKGAPDPRYYGYSVGHWEGDTTFVVDTTGLDENTWLSGGGYPHSVDAHVQERFTRTDHNNMSLSVTVDDPKIYTKPFSLGTEYFKWVPNQIFDEKLCIPSEVIEYLKSVGDPAGTAVPSGR
jgi:hypothetical protein